MDTISNLKKANENVSMCNKHIDKLEKEIQEATQKVKNKIGDKFRQSLT